VCGLGVEAPAILRPATVIQVERLLKVPTHARKGTAGEKDSSPVL
jgi:hypothetical protein